MSIYGTLGEINVGALSVGIASTATDVFVYDTRKDSDGGQWRKRTQHTSWYNETLNTATRGSRRDFPAVAVIVSTTSSVTIYDGDDPDMPLWMVFNNSNGMMLAEGQITAVSALNGIISSACGQSGYDFYIAKFIEDTGYQYSNGGSYKFYLPISGRNIINPTGVNDSWIYSAQLGVIINRFCNDVAMTVLPNAPIDSVTQLPIPTIAVATNGGVSIIKDDGTVVSVYETSGPNSVYRVKFRPDNKVFIYTSGTTGISLFPQAYAFNIPSNSISTSYFYGFTPSVIPGFEFWGGAWDGVALYGNRINVPTDGTLSGIESTDLSNTSGLFRLVVNSEVPAYSMHSHITSSYNTGYMIGDIKGAFLSDTNTASVTGTALLTGQASTYDVNTTNGGWTSQASASNAYNSTNGVGGTGCIRLTSSGGSYVYNSLSLGTVTSGAKYSITFSAKVGTSGATSFSVSASQNNVTNYAILAPTLTTSHVTYSFIFTASSTTAWFNVYAAGGTSSPVDIDNIDVRLLSEPDRSVNNTGLAVYGTITKTAVATGSNLVAYSGFNTTTNYLEQPYNSSLSFGTSDFSVTCWYYNNTGTEIRVQRTTSGADGWAITLGNASGDLYIHNGNFTTYAPFAGISNTGVWNHLTFIRRYNDKWYIYKNSVLAGTTTTLSSTNFNDTGTFKVYAPSGNSPNSIALLRVSSSIPSPDQIKKIYNDEKVLFQPNSQCTLYGASDSVTALAYDDTYQTLSVGTSSGRSDFRGLARINNTTTAVTTAISASNGLIVEQ